MSDLVRDLRDRRIMVNGGNGNVYDIADEDCEQAADRIEALEAERKVMRDALNRISWINPRNKNAATRMLCIALAALAPERGK